VPPVGGWCWNQRSSISCASCSAMTACRSPSPLSSAVLLHCGALLLVAAAVAVAVAVVVWGSHRSCNSYSLAGISRRRPLTLTDTSTDT
jgi:hypothetical protein